MKKVALILVITLVLAHISWAQSGDGWQVYSKLECSGMFKPVIAPPSEYHSSLAQAIRAADVISYRQVAEEMVSGVTVTGRTLVANLGLNYDVIATEVAAKLKDFVVIMREYKEDSRGVMARSTLAYCTRGDCKCEDPRLGIETPIPTFDLEAAVGKGLMGQLYAPDTRAKSDAISRLFDEDIKFKAPADVSVAKPYTGLIIDASAVDVKPAVAPSVWSKGGKLVYGLSIADKNSAMQYGLVHYASNIGNAKQLPYAGNNPLVVKAIKADGADVYVSDSDAALVVASNMKHDFLKQCKVTIVLGLR